MKEKKSPIRELNYVRASVSHGKGRPVLDELRQSLAVGSFKIIITTAYRVPNSGRNPLLAEVTRNYRTLLAFRPYSAVSYNKELEWSLCQIERWSAVLVNFVRLKTRLEVAAIRGEWETAIFELKNIENVCGLSGWYIAAKIALLQWSLGQEAQKEFASGIVRDCTGLGVGVAHLCSQRNEDAVSVTGYLARVEDILKEWSLSEEWSLYLRWVATGRKPETMHEASALLRVCSTGSVVDLYEALVATLSMVAGSLDSLTAGESQVFYQAIRRLDGISDARILSLPIQNRKTTLAILTESGLLFNEAIALARSEGDTDSTTTLKPLTRNLFAISNRTSDSHAQLQDMKKSALAFDFLPIGHALNAYASAVTTYGHLRYAGLRKSLAACFGPVIGPIWKWSLAENENLYSKLEEAFLNGDSNGARDICSRLEEGDVFDVIAAAKTRFEVAVKNGDWWQAIELAVHCIISTPSAAHEFPLAAITSNRSWSELRPRSERIELSIGLSYALQDATAELDRQKLHRHLQQSAIRVMRARGAKHFSELSLAAADSEFIKCFLRESCTESVMEVNTNIRSSRALSEERMKICQELSIVDEKNLSKYLDEIKQITFGLELEDGVRHFDSSRLFVNTNGLTKWGVSTLSEDFSRYLSLRSLALPDIVEIQAALRSIQLGDIGSAIPAVLLEKPKNEAERLLTEIVQKLSREFYLNPVFGLNAFLSLRIRHGSLAGHLRGPLEELGIIASRSEDGGYSPIDRWDSTKSGLSAECSKEFDLIFDRLSRDFDAIVSHLVDDLLQVRSDSKPGGFFEDFVSLVLVNGLKGDISDNATLPEVIEICVANFKAAMVPTLDRIRYEVGDLLKGRIDQILQSAVVDLECLSSGQGVTAVIDAVGRGRTNVAIAVDRVTQWFRPLDREASDRSYSIEQIVRMGEKLTTNTRPMFQPTIQLTVDCILPRLGAQSGAFLVADALFIVFDNVYMHSGLDSPIDISVQVSITEEGFLSFRIENDVASMNNLDEHQRKLDRIRSQLDSGEFRKRVSGEGGTGFFKLRRLGDAVAFEGRSNITFELSEESFIVDLLVPLVVLEVYEGAPDESARS